MRKMHEFVLPSICALLFLCAASSRAAEKTPAAPYLNPKLSIEQRVEDLLGRMTLEEKIGQMNQYIAPRYARASEPQEVTPRIEDLMKKGLVGSFLFVLDTTEANYLQRIAQNSRLGIPLINGIDAVHGLCPVRGATIFPVPVAMGGTFDPDLVERASRVTARETRASGMHWAFYPVLEVAREPRWGRSAEVFSEDPHLVEQMGLAVVRGFQGRGPGDPESIIACLKHYVAHGQPLGGRNTAPVDVSERYLRSNFFPPFEAAVKAGAGSVMAAYHEINGVPCHASEYILNDVLRGEWGFNGFVVSDWGGIERLVDPHRTAANMKEAVRQAMVAGVDMHMQGDGFTEPLIELVREGVIPESRVDQSARRILKVKMQMGLFENRYLDPAKSAKVMGAPEHVKVALEAARKSIVLLENKGGILPLKKDLKRVMVTGPGADDNSLMGDWTAPQPDGNVITVLEGIRAAVSKGTEVNYVPSGKIFEISEETIKQAVEAARAADVAVLVVGDNDARYDSEGKWDRPRRERTGGEGIDRGDCLDLLGGQLELVQAVYATGTPTVVVLINGRPLAVSWVAENVPALIEAWEPGLVGGQAVAEVLFGDINPSGKLSTSFPRSAGQLPVYYNHPYSAEVDYKFGPWKPLYEFGQGLSYTTYEYGAPVVPSRVLPGQEIPVSVEVSNTGKMAGEESVLLFVSDEVSSVATPVKALKAFQRIALAPGEKKTVTFKLSYSQLAMYDRDMRHVVEPGWFKVSAGGKEARFEVTR